MITSVVREILDKSISGDKIFGGSINYVDEVHASALFVPQQSAAPNTGSGRINGVNFVIGDDAPIGIIRAASVASVGVNTFIGVQQPSGVSRAFLSTTNSFGLLSLHNVANDSMVRISTFPGHLSYIRIPDNQSIEIGRVGGIVDTQSVKFPTGFSSPQGELESVQCTLAEIESLFLFNPGGDPYYSQTFMPTLEVIANLLTGGFGSTSIGGVWSALSGVSVHQVNQIKNIGISTSISAGQWEWLGEFDQGLSTSSDVEFNSVKSDTVSSHNAAGLSTRLITPWNFKSGLTLSWSNAGELNLSSGCCVSDDNAHTMLLNQASSPPTSGPGTVGAVNGQWGVGSGLNPSGAPYSNQWIGVFVISAKTDPNLLTTWGVDTSYAANDLRTRIASVIGGDSTNYTYRRIGYVFIEMDGSIRRFVQNGNIFTLIQQIVTSRDFNQITDSEWVELDVKAPRFSTGLNYTMCHFNVSGMALGSSVSIGTLFFHHVLHGPTVNYLPDPPSRTNTVGTIALLNSTTPVTVPAISLDLITRQSELHVYRTGDSVGKSFDMQLMGWTDMFNDNEW